MAIRTTQDRVKAVLLRDYDGETDLQASMETATDLVDRAVAYGADVDVVPTSTQLENLERWLAAHFYAVSDRTYSNRSTEGASGTFDGQTAMGLDATLYGQTAKLIDPTGYLRTLDADPSTPTGRPRVRLSWLGSEEPRYP